ncbi:MAG: 50S ribosomal protein L10, partial [Coriobacteriales bacterium]|nr:50S ribosomal protein L10 [Coriobacteriales bacterium]
MPNQRNVAMLDKIKGSIEASKGFFVVDYRGLTVKEAQDVRRSLREANAEMKVYKNNIMLLDL